jgi:hypothetical protein
LKVYVAIRSYHYDASEVLGVFATPELAEAHLRVAADGEADGKVFVPREAASMFYVDASFHSCLRLSCTDLEIREFEVVS